MKFSRHIVKAIVLASFFSLSACENGVDGGGSIGGGAGSIDSTVVVSGKVSLLGSSSSATTQKLTTAQKLTAMTSVPQGRPGSRTYMKTRQVVQKTSSDGDFLRAATVIDSAKVLLYNADHPEWLYPVSETFTDSSGNYVLTKLKNAALNLDAAGNSVYSDGDYIPEGKYTLLAFKPGGFDPILGITTDPIVAVQTVVNSFSGTVSAADLAAQSSTVKPKVDTIVGLKKNTDGTQTWGVSQAAAIAAGDTLLNTTTKIAANAAIPVTFSMAMSRASVLNGVSIEPAVAGEWKVSSDWLSAVFYPDITTGLIPGTEYTLTVNGSETSSPVTNVYGNPLKRTAVATFTADPADNINPVVSILSPSSGAGVSVFDPIRITSDESLDVNSVLLTSTPTLGVKPGVFFVGKNTSGQYIYEFLLANPLTPSTTYDITVSGGTDMSGNAMTLVSRSFTTVTAASVAGIDPATDAVTQGIQADVLNVFGRWIRALNDRSIGMLQEMMTGDYVFEYDVGAHGPENNDLNRDGRLDLEEFSTMVSEGFSRWDVCGTTIEGTPVDNVNVVADVADFQFDLSFISTNNSQDCSDSPGEMFATVYNINGKWQVGRVSQGIDTRNQELTTRAVVSGLELRQDEVMQNGIPWSAAGSSLDGVTLKVLPSRIGGIVSNAVEFLWNKVDGATAYVFYIVNTRDEDRGRAYILPSTMTSWKMPRNSVPDINECTGNKAVIPVNVVDVRWMFNFWDDCRGMGLQREGEEFYWTVMALDTNVPGDFDVDGNGRYIPDDSNEESRASNLFQQISAISRQVRYSNTGIYKELNVAVTLDGVTPLTFNENYDGYDAGASDSIRLSISTPNLDAGNVSAQISINGHSWQGYPINFDPTGQITYPITTDPLLGGDEIPLFSGWNWIEIYDGVDLYKQFSIRTTGGTPPVMSITGITSPDASVNYVTDPNVNYDAGFRFLDAQAVDIKTVRVTGQIIDPLIAISTATLNMNLWNDRGIYESKQVIVTPAAGQGTFDVQIPVYGGHNWINFDVYYCDASATPVCNNAYTHMGVQIEFDKGTPWTPPIDNIEVVIDPLTNTLADLTDDYGQSQNWDASADTDARIRVRGKLQYPDGSRFNISSDGAWSDGDIITNADGSFSFPVDLYNGWNYVSINDGQGNWFGVNIYTTGGNTVTRPVINTIEGIAYNNTGMASVDSCTAIINGQALADSSVQVNWNGDDGAGNYYYESFFLAAGPDTGNGLGDFSITVPVISGGYNYVDVFDVNWRNAYVQLSTTLTCAYTQPILTPVSIDANPAFDPGTFTWWSGDYSTAASTVILAGTSNLPGRKIVVRNYTCTGEEKFETQVDGAGNWTITANVYQDYNWLDINDGFNYQGVSVYSTNIAQPTPNITGVTVTADSGVVTSNNSGCNYENYTIDAAGAPQVTSVTVSGSTTAPDGDGTYWDANGNSQVFSIVNGDFGFTVNIFDGSNYISLNDTRNNYYSFDFNVVNGVQKPRIVNIDQVDDPLTTGVIEHVAPIHDSIVVPSAYIVSGVIDRNAIDISICPTCTFNADTVTAYVYDEATGNSNNYTTLQADVDAFGYGLITLGIDGAGNQTFSFDITVTDETYPFYISVDAVDEQQGWYSHGHSIYLNNVYNYGQWSYKPGAKVINQKPLQDLKDRANRQRAESAFKQLNKRD